METEPAVVELEAAMETGPDPQEEPEMETKGPDTMEKELPELGGCPVSAYSGPPGMLSSISGAGSVGDLVLGDLAPQSLVLRPRWQPLLLKSPCQCGPESGPQIPLPPRVREACRACDQRHHWP